MLRTIGASLMETAKITFGRRLRLLRKSRGLTLEQLGRAASVGYKHIAEIERGQKVPSFDAIDKLAAALKVATYEFFLPYINDTSSLDQSLQRLTREMNRGSPGIKRFLVVVLALLGQLEMEWPTAEKRSDEILRNAWVGRMSRVDTAQQAMNS